MWSFPWYITVIGMLLTCTLAQLDGSFWWKKNVQVKSLANIDNEHSAKIRTLSPNAMFGTITENSILGEKFNDDDDDVDMFKINNSPDCICVLRNLCGADQASSTTLCSKNETCCKPTGVLKLENHTTSLPKNEVSGCVASQSATRSARIYFPGEIRKVVQDGLVENMATIFRKVSSKNKVLCSGIFLNQETIVTVAHCVKEFAQNFTSIYIGISSSIEAVIKSPVTRVTVHPQFYSDYYGLYNDIAIVKFVPLQNAFRSTVCLPINSDAFEGSCKLISSTNDETKIIYVDLVGTTLCQDWIQENIADRSRKFKLYNSSICGLERKCEANKGGDGLYCQRNGVYYLTGLVSWGLNCNLPGVYTNIAYLENWIINNV